MANSPPEGRSGGTSARDRLEVYVKFLQQRHNKDKHVAKVVSVQAFNVRAPQRRPTVFAGSVGFPGALGLGHPRNEATIGHFKSDTWQ